MAIASPFLAAQIGHTEIAEFAADCVNLKREDAEECSKAGGLTYESEDVPVMR